MLMILENEKISLAQNTLVLTQMCATKNPECKCIETLSTISKSSRKLSCQKITKKKNELFIGKVTRETEIIPLFRRIFNPGSALVVCCMHLMGKRLLKHMPVNENIVSLL